MKDMTKEERQARIAKNVAALIDADESYSVINLGVGIPTQVADYLTREDVFVMAENGILGAGHVAVGDEIHPDLINAGRQPIVEEPGCSYCDSSFAFGMIRGGHIGATVLGAFEVDENADVANWIIPGGKQLGVGGAMDLVSGAKRVIIAMTHLSKTGTKLVKKCSLPVTSRGTVSIVVTEYAVFFFENGRLVLRKIAPEISLEELRGITGIEFAVAESLAEMVV